MAVSPERQLVTMGELRKRYNEGGYWERTLENEFILRRKKNPLAKPAIPTPDRPGTWITEGTRSQTWEYYDRKTRQKIAVVHQYVRPDGMIAAWGRPDPMMLLEGGVEYYTDKMREAS